MSAATDALDTLYFYVKRAADGGSQQAESYRPRSSRWRPSSKRPSKTASTCGTVCGRSSPTNAEPPATDDHEPRPPLRLPCHVPRLRGALPLVHPPLHQATRLHCGGRGYRPPRLPAQTYTVTPFVPNEYPASLLLLASPVIDNGQLSADQRADLERLVFAGVVAKRTQRRGGKVRTVYTALRKAA